MNSLTDTQPMGFTYTVETVRRGKVVDREVVHNLMPIEGLNHTLSVLLKGAAQNAAWYIAPYEGNYTPNGSETAATVSTATTECTAYAESTRVLFQSGAVSAGSVDNAANRAEFNMNASKTMRGAFLISTSGKGAASGVVLSIVRFSSPKPLEAGDVFRVLAGNSFASA